MWVFWLLNRHNEQQEQAAKSLVHYRVLPFREGLPGLPRSLTDIIPNFLLGGILQETLQAGLVQDVSFKITSKHQHMQFASG